VTLQPNSINEKLWERLRYRGAPMKQHVLGDLPDSAAPFGDAVWRSFKWQCAADGNIQPLLIAQSEPQDPAIAMFRRHGPRKLKGSTHFEDLPLVQRLKAEVVSGGFARSGLETFPRGGVPSWREPLAV